MKATINLEFTDQELIGLVERWANKVVVGALGDLSRQVEPLMPLIRDIVMRAVAGQPVQGAPVPGTPSAQPPFASCEEELLAHCTPIEGVGALPGWECHKCRTPNGTRRMQCKRCGHDRCGPHFAPRPSAPDAADQQRDALGLYETIIGDYPAEKTTIIVQWVVDGVPKGDRVMVPSRPRDAEELLAAIKAIHGPSVPPATYEVGFFSESKVPLGAGWVTIPGTPDPSPPSPGN